MATSLITLDGYCIERKTDEDAVFFVLHKGDAVLAKADDLEYIADVMWADFKAQRLNTMQRVNNPNIRITMSIR